MAKHSSSNVTTRFIWATITCWALYLLMLILPRLGSALFPVVGLLFTAGGLLTVVSIFLLVRGTSHDSRDDSKTHSPLAKIISILLLISLVVCIVAAVQSLWTPLFDTARNKFFLENTATASLVASIVFVIVLSTIQRDIYWVGEKTTTFDERQIAERRTVFEKSYKISALTLFIAALFAPGYIGNFNEFTQRSTMGLPGHVMLPVYTLVVFLFALPLVIATWRSQKAK